jgi:hypothetical protein
VIDEVVEAAAAVTAALELVDVEELAAIPPPATAPVLVDVEMLAAAAAPPPVTAALDGDGGVMELKVTRDVF